MTGQTTRQETAASAPTAPDEPASDFATRLKSAVEGLGSALTFLFLAILCAYFPVLVGWSSTTQLVFRLIGIFALATSVTGAGYELEELTGNETLGHLGTASPVVIIAVALLTWAESGSLAPTAAMAAEVLVFALLALACIPVGSAVASIVVRPPKRERGEGAESQTARVAGAAFTGLLSLTLLVLQIANQVMAILGASKK